jgi:DNA-binding SARP family transcriptional activator/Tol biopolymer transport system component
MAAIEFRTLGTLDLRRSDGSELHSLLAQPKRLALLAYLCVARPRGFHRRDTLLGLFWPDADQTHARTSLRNALYVLRHSLGETAFPSRGDEEIGVSFDAICCDAVTFEEHLALGKVEAALELYRGDLLAGFFLEDVPAFERWLEAERARLSGCAVAAAITASERSESARNIPEALQWVRRAVELANTDERAVRRLIKLLVAAGDHAGALHAYDRFAKHIATELQAEPSAETRALVKPLREHQPAEQTVVASRASLAGEAKRFDADSPGYPSAGETERVIGGWRNVVTRRVAARTLVGFSLLVAALSIAQALNGRTGMGTEVRQKLTTTGNAMMASLSPDGQFLAYVAQAGDSQHVLLQDISGGIPRAVSGNKGAIWSLEWSPDGTRLLVGGKSRGMLVPRLGGEATLVGPGVASQAMAYWLPDNSRVSVHSAPDRRILVFDPTGQDTLSLPVTGNYTFMREGSWSPNGRVFAVLTETTDPVRWEIRAVSMDGKTEVVLTDSVMIGFPRWSREGNELYYPQGVDRLWRIPVSPLTGAARGKPLEVAGNLEMYSTRWGRPHFGLTGDGKGLVYARGARFSNVWLVERVAGQSQPRTIALTSGTSLRWCPVVSPDGKSIVFAQKADGIGELFTLPIDGGPAVRITSGARVHPESQIAWSPDGTRVAFNTIRDGRSQVWVANVREGTMRGFPESRMSTTTGALTWSPGSSIAYQTTDGGSINLLDPVSGQQRTLASSTASGWANSPAYSPDGKTIVAFYSPGVRNGRGGIWAFDVYTSASRRVSGGLYPRGWSPDAQFIYFQWPQSPVIYRLDSRGGKPEEIFLTPPFREAQCRPVGATRPNAFICAAFDLTSDIWKIDNFDRGEE